jgi:hypothetical protein
MKNLIVGAIVGLAFMAGGFWYGLRLKPLPTPQSVAALAATAAAEVKPPAPPPISLDTLKKTSETMMSLNEALQVREKAVADREEKVARREDELGAERTALDASHAKFKELFNEFQQRLVLVEANQADQLQKQADLYTAMGTVQSIDLIRGKDDEAMVRLFSVMDTKPLAKLISDWKTKYPEDAPRLLHVLDAMATVMPKEKIALSEPPATPIPGSPDSAAPAAAPAPTPTTPDSTSTPAPTPDSASAPAATSSDSTATPSTAAAPAPDAPAVNSNAAPAPGDVPVAPSADPNGASPVAQPVSDPSSIPAAPGAPATPPSPPPLAPPPDSKHSGTSTAAANW